MAGVRLAPDLPDAYYEAKRGGLAGLEVLSQQR